MSDLVHLDDWRGWDGDGGDMRPEPALAFLDRLRVPEGPRSGEPLGLAEFQRDFVRGALAPGTLIGVLSIGRGNGKSTLTAALALGELLGMIGDRQPRREILVAARTHEQARVVFNFVQGLAHASLAPEVLAKMSFRRAPYAEIEFNDGRSQHLIRCVAAEGKNILGTSPTLAIMDERGHWQEDKGDDLEGALLSGLGKRGGRGLIISTSASSDSHSFSQWCDDPPAGCYVQEHRPAPGLPADDRDSLAIANPGAVEGIGANLEWLEAQARRAISRGGSALSTFRLFNRNERVAGESRNVLVTIDEWLAAEVTALPPREGPAVLGIDLGGSASMSAAALFWPATGRLEAYGAFPTVPSLLDRGQADGVRDRYVEMEDRGELFTMGDRVVPPAQFLALIMDRLDGTPLRCIVGDRYRQGEFLEAIQAARVRVPLVFRGMGFRDGSEDCERFRSSLYDGRISVSPSLLLRSAFADAVTLSDPSGNLKLTKARSLGRIDAAAATILAVAEGARQAAAESNRRPVAARWL